MFLMNKVEDAAKIGIIQALLQLAEGGKLRIVVSNLVLAEVRSREEHDEEHRRICDELFNTNRPYMQFYGVSRNIALRARDIGSQFNRITVPDAIHIATAIEASVDAFLTYDGDSDRKNRRSGRLLAFDGQIGSPPLKIQVPVMDYGPMFELASAPEANE